jgi:hypothetical protein
MIARSSCLSERITSGTSNNSTRGDQPQRTTIITESPSRLPVLFLQFGKKVFEALLMPPIPKPGKRMGCRVDQ